jgi:8-oxo-dGTP pyrophosphatase MutT (NUDIX family)
MRSGIADERRPRARLAKASVDRQAGQVTRPTTAEVPIALAATVVVLRDAEKGLEVLLMQRADSLAFHGGAWVFPGGRVDPCDLVDDHALSDEARACATARRAAVREAHEEAGIALTERDLVALSHWTTPRGRPRRFSTWFFATMLPRAGKVVVDGKEIQTHRWLHARDALTLQAAGEIELPPPTFVTLSVLAPFASTSAFLEGLSHATPPVFEPRLAGEVALYHGDAAYEGGALEQPGPRHRLHMQTGAWRYEALVERH